MWYKLVKDVAASSQYTDTIKIITKRCFSVAVSYAKIMWVYNIEYHNSKFESCDRLHYTGRFITFSVITNIYNKKTKEPTLMELFTATGKLETFFDN
jgi:hypothetical protein